MNSKNNQETTVFVKHVLMPYWGEGVVWVDVKFGDCRHKLRLITANLTQIISLKIFSQNHQKGWHSFGKPGLPFQNNANWPQRLFRNIHKIKCFVYSFSWKRRELRVFGTYYMQLYSLYIHVSRCYHFLEKHIFFFHFLELKVKLSPKFRSAILDSNQVL